MLNHAGNAKGEIAGIFKLNIMLILFNISLSLKYVSILRQMRKSKQQVYYF